MNLEEILNWVDKTGMIGNLKNGGYLFNIGFEKEDGIYWLSKSAIDSKGYIRKDGLLDIRNTDRNEFIREIREKLSITDSDKIWTTWKKSKRTGHGGKREGSGRKSEYNNLKTKLIRLPEIYEDKLKNVGRMLAFGDFNSYVAISNKNRNPEIEKTSMEDLKKLQKQVTSSIEVLQESLKLKANAGGKIKKEIRKAIKVLEEI